MYGVVCRFYDREDSVNLNMRWGAALFVNTPASARVENDLVKVNFRGVLFHLFELC